MALFNFFSSKSSSNNTPTNGNHIVAFDLDTLESKNVNWDFISKFENPEFWIFTSTKENEKLKELEQSFVVKTFSLPQDTRQSPFWVLGVVMFELQNLKDFSKITLVAPLPYYEAISEYLKLKGLFIDFLLLEPNISKLPKTSTSTKEKSVVKVNDKNENQERKTSNKRNLKREPIIKELNPTELQQICDAFKEHFELEGVYEKKALGQIVQIATGKTLHKVFHTRNAKLYVGCLYQNGVIENINENDFKLIKYPTIEVFPKEVKVIPKKIRKHRTKRKKNY